MFRSPRDVFIYLHGVIEVYVFQDYVPDKLSELAEALANPIKYQSELDKREHQLAVLTDGTDEPEQEPRRSVAQPVRHEAVPESSPSKLALETKKLIETESIVTLPLPPPTDTKEQEKKANGTDESLAETLETLLNSKLVRLKEAELARKLDTLRRKFDKDKKPFSAKFYVSNKLVKKLSSNNMCGEAGGSGAAEEGAAEERALRLRYHHAIYAALEKHVRADHSQQMKTLSDLLEVEKKEILNRLANSRKEDVKALAKKTNRDKDEIQRIKREIHSQSVERGVSECCRLEQAYTKRREQLARDHEKLLQMLLKHRDQELVKLDRLCGGAPEG